LRREPQTEANWLRGHDRLVEQGHKRLDPGREVDGGADHGEIEPRILALGRADIAVGDRAGMEADADLQGRPGPWQCAVR
jgi:hypothetical protein